MGSGTVTLVLYRDKSEAPQAFPITQGDWSPLRKALEAVAHDGATHPGSLRPVPDAREYLLFSHGLGNFGAQPFPDLKAPVFAASAASQADFDALRHVAEKSGGRAVDLVRQEPSEAAVPPHVRSCSSGQRFAFGFLQISSHPEHPCRSANSSPCRASRGLPPPSECALPGAPRKKAPSRRTGPPCPPTRYNW